MGLFRKKKVINTTDYLDYLPNRITHLACGRWEQLAEHLAELVHRGLAESLPCIYCSSKNDFSIHEFGPIHDAGTSPDPKGPDGWLELQTQIVIVNGKEEEIKVWVDVVRQAQEKAAEAQRSP